MWVVNDPKDEHHHQDGEDHTDHDIKQTLVKWPEGDPTPRSSVDEATIHRGQAQGAADVEERKDEPTDHRRDAHTL
jgi:hypothetical protein